MKIELWLVGKTDANYLKEGIAAYEKRLKHYTTFEIQVLPEVKNGAALPPDVLKQKEGDIMLQKLQKDDFFVLLDERGKTFSSIEFADFIEKKQLNGTRRLIFQVGGAFGFSEAIYQRANAQISLSRMTFSHQMIRVFFVEQIYRAFTIIKNEKYHNE